MSIAQSLSESLVSGSIVAAPVAFVGGVLTGLNPCCLPLYPAAAATCCATRGGSVSDAGRRARPSVSRAFAFVGGIALATTLLGVGAAWAGRTLTGAGVWGSLLVAAVLVAAGLHVLRVIRLPLPARKFNGTGRGAAGAFAAGLLISLVLVPCGTPVLAAVLAYAAATQHLVWGGLLLFAYGLGTGLPVLLLGTAAGGLAERLDASTWRPWVDRITGVALLGMGIFVAVR